MNTQDLTTLAKLSPITEDSTSQLNDERVTPGLTSADFCCNAERKLAHSVFDQIPGNVNNRDKCGCD